MSRLIDLTDQIFNGIKVIKRNTELNSDRGAIWDCLCPCGNIFQANGSALRKGRIKSCRHCKEKEEITPIQKKHLQQKYSIGEKFGHVTIIDYCDYTKTHHTYVKCKCECGNIFDARTDSLTQNLNCGCLKKEKTSKQWTSNLLGKRFGKLTVVAKEKTPNQYRSLWKCVCDCGEICFLPSRYLLSNQVKSCGCETKSKRELEIRGILNQKNINFQTEYTFEDCVSTQSYKLRFDFALFNNLKQVVGLIEFNGIQHYKPIPYWGGEERFNRQKESDNIKKDYCFNKKIPLLIIKYTELGKINLDDFLKQINLTTQED